MLYYSGCRNLTSPWTTPTILTSIDYDNDHEFHISSQHVNDTRFSSIVSICSSTPPTPFPEQYSPDISRCGSNYDERICIVRSLTTRITWSSHYSISQDHIIDIICRWKNLNGNITYSKVKCSDCGRCCCCSYMSQMRWEEMSYKYIVIYKILQFFLQKSELYVKYRKYKVQVSTCKTLTAK
jgi:hypothetical protein